MLCSAHPVVQYPCGNSPSQMLITAIALHKMARTLYKNSPAKKTTPPTPNITTLQSCLGGRQAGAHMRKDKGAGGYVDSSSSF